MRYLRFFIGLACFSFFGANAQTNISGIVNDYAAVISLDTCAGSLLLSGDISNFIAGEKILIMQMKGASISTANNGGFGTVTDMGGAGLYEMANIASVSGQQLYLANRLLNTYDFSKKVQVVTVKTYENAWVVDTVFAKAWDGITGGIVAIEVTGTLTLQAPISATAKGYRGATSIAQTSGCNSLTNADNYFYDVNNWRGSPKGEGVSDWIVGMEHGRGAQSNGGGGGNDHNSGGGGGGNLSKGGKGGLNDEPYFLNCSGEFPGEGSKDLLGIASRVYFGGGGGSGHRNNNNNSDGGSGGGFVYVKSSTIAGNGYSIDANGADAETVKQDGGGGGGGGGTILVQADLISGLLTLNAVGGWGGSVNNQNNDRCFGPGGGGSGGRILSNVLANVSTNLLFGSPGTTFNSTNACNGSTVGAESGEVGSLSAVIEILQGTAPWQLPLAIQTEPVILTPICAGNPITITVNATGATAYQWELDLGLGFQPTSDNAVFAGSATQELTILNPNSSLDGALFQCVITGGNCFTPNQVFTNVVSLQVLPQPVASFSVASIGTIGVLTANDPNMASYYWEFEGGQTANGQETNFDFIESGTYLVTLTTSNECGTTSNVQLVSIATPPISGFQSQVSGVCAPLIATFNNTSTPGTYTWLFPGGSPSSSTATNPVVTYSTPGFYDVRLITVNQFGSDTTYYQDYIVVGGPPSASFNAVVNNFSVQFNNTSQGGVAYLWNLGNSAVTELSSPNYTYPSQPNTYTITLTVTNQCGTSTEVQQITVGQLATASINTGSSGGCAPFSTTLFGIGQFVDTWSWETPGATATTAPNLPQITLTYDQPGLYDINLTVSNAGGSNTINFPNFIEVTAFPIAEFSFTQNAQNIQFFNLSSDAEGYEWDFGDNSPLFYGYDATHTYQEMGAFVATLTAYNQYCADSYSHPINTTDTRDLSVTPTQLLPQPADTWVTVMWPNTLLHGGTLQIFSASGQKISDQNVVGNNVTIAVAHLPSGMYPFRIISEDSISFGKIIVVH